MNLSDISNELHNFVKQETIQLLDLIFTNEEINNLYPGLSDKKKDIIEKYFKDKLILQKNNKEKKEIDTNRCIALLRNGKQCSNKKNKTSNYCTRHCKIRKFGEISL